MATLTKDRIAREIAALIGLTCSTRNRKAHKIVDIVLKSMAKALLDGQRIYIRGFGIFSLRTSLRGRHIKFYNYGDKGESNIRCHGYKKVKNPKPYTYVHFYPSKVLKRLVNSEGIV